MNRNKKSIITGLVLILIVCLSTLSHAEEKSLYQRLGGYDAISAVVNEFADRLFSDKKLEPFFGALNADSRDKFKQLNTLLVCAGTGGPCMYLGRSMTTSHQGMGVTNDDFNTVAGHLVATLDNFKVPDAEKNELLGIIGSMRSQIVKEKNVN